MYSKPVLSAEDVPKIMRCPHILSGYRPVGMSWSDVLRSAFAMHNETINTATHLLPAPIYWYQTLRVLFGMRGVFDRARDRLALGAYMVTASTLLTTSASFHLGLCKDVPWFKLLRCCDYEAINFLMNGCYLPAIWLTLGQLPRHANTARRYQLVVLAVWLWTTVKNWCSPGSPCGCAATDEVTERSRARTQHNFVVIATWGMIMVAHFCVAHWRDPSMWPKVAQFLRSVTGMWACFGCGFAWYLSLWPECSCPGKYDYWFHSHQFWHVFVVLGTWWWYKSMLRLNSLNVQGRRQAAEVAAAAFFAKVAKVKPAIYASPTGAPAPAFLAAAVLQTARLSALS